MAVGLALLAVSACDDTTPPGGGRAGLLLIAIGLTNPLYVTAPPEDQDRVFVVEQVGRIRVIRRDTLLTRPFLDLRAHVTVGSEQGLLGMAFHPRYAQNGFMYAHYTNLGGDSRVVRYRVTADGDSADPLSGDTLLAVDQLNVFHQGGWLGFGPDGYLYVALGDGAAGGGRDLSILRGKVLRLDVDAASPYAVPASNPHVGQAGAQPEIWASGLRNPWRVSFDRVTGDFYIGDVGQLDWEEVNVQPAASVGGEDYGWPTLEGSHCFNAPTCDPTGMTLPLHEYGHADGCAVIGGYVYRGSAVPELAGRYLFSDLCSARVWSFRYTGAVAADLSEHTAFLSPGTAVTSFGEDARGELYLLTLDGLVYRVVRV
jgi:glucose/arabinose dehydrogenase